MKLHTYAGAAAVLAMAIGSTAGAQAQSWQSGNGIVKFLGCYVDQETVLCDVTYTLNKVDSDTFSLNYGSVQYYTASGTTGNADTTSVAGSRFSGYAGSTAISGIPVKGTFKLPLPTTTTSIAALVIYGHRVNNVVVSKAGAPAMDAPVAVKPATPPAVTVPVNAGIPAGFAIRLSNCKVASGTYTCVATLTPLR